jgi:adenosylcobinamide-GDP ribazoletransferase
MTPQTFFRDIALCVTFFTRLPVPRLDLAGNSLGAALWAAPIAGWAVALIGGAVFALASALGLSTGPSAALALAATMAATGCLHEDGLSDTADGFGGGRNSERALEIMRDSRIGAYGACALALSILLRWTALAELGSPAAVLAGMVAAHGASRALLPAFMRLVPPARADGLSAGAGAVEAPVANAALALGLLSLFALGLDGAILAAIPLAAAFFLLRALCISKIGGQTGDTAGALQQSAEILVLLAASALF